MSNTKLGKLLSKFESKIPFNKLELEEMDFKKLVGLLTEYVDLNDFLKDDAKKLAHDTVKSFSNKKFTVAFDDDEVLEGVFKNLVKWDKELSSDYADSAVGTLPTGEKVVLLSIENQVSYIIDMKLTDFKKLK